MDLDEMFRRAISEDNAPQGTSWRNRNLPASFFRPPEGPSSANHSREGSLDQPFSPPSSVNKGSASSLTGGSPTMSPSPTSHLRAGHPPPHPSHMLVHRRTVQGGPSSMIVHSRGQSAPAVIQPSLSVMPSLSPSPLTLQPSGMQQVNVPNNNNNVNSPNQGPFQSVGIIHGRGMSYDVDKLKFPQGWEMAIDKGTGKRYFIDHANKTTTWNDPRFLILQQQQMNQLRHQQQQQQQQQQRQQQMQQQQQPLPSLPLPEGWEEKRTPEGDVYYINHLNRTTTWVDPRTSMAAVGSQGRRQAPPPIGSPSPSTTPTPSTSTANSTHNLIMLNGDLMAPQVTLNNNNNNNNNNPLMSNNNNGAMAMGMGTYDGLMVEQRIQLLALEREKLKRRQEELREGAGDPFLCNNVGHHHSRQQSSDSGLGLGSFPVTPKHSTGHGHTLAPLDDSIPMNDDQSMMDTLANMDLGPDPDMDSDDLMSTIPGLGLGEDLHINDIEFLLHN